MKRHIPGAQFFDDKKVAVLGLGVSGRAAIQALATHTSAELGAWDQSPSALATITSSQVAHSYACHDGGELVADVIAWQPDLVVIAPGFRQTGVEWQALRQAQLPVWSEIELAWQLRSCSSDGQYAPWLCVTGTNGKTTTVAMLESILQSAGRRACAVGNVGKPAVTAVSDVSEDAPEVVAVELSSFQLAATFSMEPTAAIVLNLADDHLEWHASRSEYAAAKASIYERTHIACLYPVGDSVVQDMVDNAEVIEGARAIGLSLGIPSRGELGFVEDAAVDRAFIPNAHRSAAELFTLADIAHLTPAGYDLPAHIVKDALAAAALARSIGVEPEAVSQGLRQFHSASHRIELVGNVEGVSYIDDSKATNAHAAQASLRAQDKHSTVWIVGGLAKGATFTDLVARVEDRLAGVVVIGVDQSPWRAALQNLQVPVTFIDNSAPEPMDEAVHEAHRMAKAGQTVLLAPASASQDQFASYSERGEKFEQAVRDLQNAGREG
ncbi:UDP-N-acetylmuramoyl-L-alanine--D-glutamate ligase [Arcanobacterium pinnipediorum]|uniref:UDP-N-acetylmuramoylalanine--D-glutamate ligase n=1 Tax=Arcanobacterium pinnipediorum TaxID=1503041 RepID=A0ABY5AIK0_9ACTO|nr:UDP-N-acetylmuramoyl-L-alanine--D-glutamate ligase [Arcanobacterium pinnipediorum]USR80029.1 UDP-N-acetylmuramoyl-L-alanine--D-glutamate ligase [Arcanobacterium pinnipediorum]